MAEHAGRIRVAHASGKWSKTKTPAFDANVKRMRAGGRTAVTRTEATARGFNREINWPDDGWGHRHPVDGPGHDCSVEWDRDEWAILDAGVLQLTDIRIRTALGHLLEPCSLTWTLLGHEGTGIELELGAAHLDLRNTARRRAANLEACHTLRGHYQMSRGQDPRRRHLLHMDGNRDQRDPQWRNYFAAELAAGTGMRSGWHAPLPSSGTHGRALLDLAMADFPIDTRLLADDPASDHRPIETIGHLSYSRGAAPA